MRSVLLALLLAPALWACQTAYVGHASQVRTLLAQENFAGAVDADLAGAAAYGKGDRVLALLNQGALQRDAARYPASNASLLAAEDRLTAFYRRSTGGALAQGLLSGSAGDYLADDYERILVNVLAIQNYLALGERDDAMVEVRRLTGKLGILSDVKGHGHRYQGDGFAEWLSGLLFEDDGDLGNAGVSYRDALKAFPPGILDEASHAQLCLDARRAALRAGISAPELPGCDPAQPLPPPDGWGELVLIHSAGLVPERGQRRLSCSAPAVCFSEDEQHPAATVKLVSIAVPELRPVPAQVQGAALSLDDGAPVTTARLEDVERIAIETLQDKLPGYQSQAATRALARVAAGAATGVGSAKLAGSDSANPQKAQNAAALGLAVGVLTDLALSETEEADKRSWFTLPAWIGVARVRAPPGPHRVHAELLDAQGHPLGSVDLGTVTLVAGQRTYLGLRTVR